MIVLKRKAGRSDTMKQTQGARATLVALMTALIATVSGALAPALGQPAGCTLVADDRNPKEKMLRCGDALTIRAAANSKYQRAGETGQSPPTEVRLESGALLIDFKPSERARNFQILTPHAIAAVRGTRYAVEVTPARSSTLVLEGEVEVSRARDGQRSARRLGVGQGADVTAKPGPVVVQRWDKKRVDALLARFGQ
jgi:ferric-dicitrate binding protein FerR (iron transport regulator)